MILSGNVPFPIFPSHIVIFVSRWSQTSEKASVVGVSPLPPVKWIFPFMHILEMVFVVLSQDRFFTHSANGLKHFVIKVHSVKNHLFSLASAFSHHFCSLGKSRAFKHLIEKEISSYWKRIIEILHWPWQDDPWWQTSVQGDEDRTSIPESVQLTGQLIQ